MTFPALLLLAVWVLSALFNSAEVRSDLIEQIIGALPLEEVEGRRQLSELLNGLTKGAGSLGLATALILLYSGSSAIGALRHAVETAQDDGTPGRAFPRSKLFDILITAVTLPVILLVIALTLSKDLSSIVKGHRLLESISALLGSDIATMAVSILLLTWLFWVLNPGSRTWQSALVGAAASTGLCWLVWLGLRLWFSVTGGGSAVYGVLAGFLGLLLFLNLACNAIVIGTHLATAFRTRRPLLG